MNIFVAFCFAEIAFWTLTVFLIKKAAPLVPGFDIDSLMEGLPPAILFTVLVKALFFSIILGVFMSTGLIVL